MTALRENGPEEPVRCSNTRVETEQLDPNVRDGWQGAEQMEFNTKSGSAGEQNQTNDSTDDWTWIQTE